MIAYHNLFSFAAMAIQKKDLYGPWYLRLEYFAWVQVLLLCMEFRTYGVLKYDAIVSFNSIEDFAYAFHFIIKCYPQAQLWYLNTFISQTPENIHYAALVIGGSILIEGVIPEHLFSLFILVI
jgi:hypothetical protein